jgi:uncharacterized membrane protein (Fun14 family)
MNVILLQILTQTEAADAGSALWKLAKPVLTRLGFGGILGWSVGFLFKKSMKLLAILLALIFIGLQFLVAKGYIQNVDWTAIGADFRSFFNKEFFTNLGDFLLLNLPFGVGFFAGFVLGLKMG